MVHWQAGLPEFFFMYGSSQQVPASAQNRENWEADGPNVHGCWILLGEQHYLQIWLVWWLGLSGKLQETMFFHLPSNYRGCLWNVPLIQFWGAGSWSRPLGPKKYMNHLKKIGSINHLILREMTHVKPPARIHWFDSSKTKIWGFMGFFSKFYGVSDVIVSLNWMFGSNLGYLNCRTIRRASGARYQRVTTYSVKTPHAWNPGASAGRNSSHRVRVSYNMCIYVYIYIYINIYI